MPHGSWFRIQIGMIRFRDRFDDHPCSADSTENSVERVSKFDRIRFAKQACLAHRKRLGRRSNRCFNDISALVHFQGRLQVHGLLVLRHIKTTWAQHSSYLGKYRFDIGNIAGAHRMRDQIKFIRTEHRKLRHLTLDDLIIHSKMR